jgi:two-component system, NarL family, invasion response regulator UvrY
MTTGPMTRIPAARIPAARGASVRVLLVDDHAIVREGYRCLLEKHGAVEVVGEAADGAEAYRRFQELAPDVVVMDLSMPGQGGVEAIRHIRQRDPRARILVFSMHQNAAFAIKAMEAGAKGYVTKSSAPEVLVRALFEAAAGRCALSPDISHELAMNRLTMNRGDGESRPLDELSPREFEILRMLVEDNSTKEIASVLNLSHKTVCNYHYQIKSKLGVKSDIGLVRMALQLGLADLPDP